MLPPALTAAGAAALGAPAIATVSAVLTLALGAFFRDPERSSEAEPDAVVSPADGRVLAVDSGDEGLRVTIFLSVFDVHVTRSPLAGTLDRCERIAGGYAVAFRDAARHNARVQMKIDSDRGTAELALMAGAVARRIVTWVRAPTVLRRGQRLGIIRFGSRAELRLPRGSAAVASVGDTVRAGETVLARLPSGGETVRR